MVLSVKIVILQCMLALLIGVHSAEATSNSQRLLDDKLSLTGLSFSSDADGADLDPDTDFSFLEQTQLNTTKHVSRYVTLFPQQKFLGYCHSTPPIRAPPRCLLEYIVPLAKSATS